MPKCKETNDAPATLQRKCSSAHSALSRLLFGNQGLWRQLLAAPVVALLLQVSAAASESAQMPADMVEDLQANASALDPCRVEWTMRRVSQFDMAALVGQIAMMPHWRDDTSFLSEESARCAIDGGKILVRFNYQEPILTMLRPPSDVQRGKSEEPGSPVLKDTTGYVKIVGNAQETLEASFDGSHVFTGVRRKDGKPDTLLVYSRDHALKTVLDQGMPEEVAEQRWRHNYFYEAGFDVPTNEYDYANPTIGSLVLRLASKEHAQVEHGVATIDGRECRTVGVSTGGRKFNFYLDAEMHHAVRRREEYDDRGRLLSVSTANDFRSVPGMPSLSLPFRIRVEHFQWRGAPAVPAETVLFESHYTLVSCEKQNTPAADFALTYHSAGALVGDDRLPTADQRESGLVNYIAPADPEDLDAAIQHAIDGTPYIRSPSAKRFIFLGVNVLIICALFLAIWYARSRRQVA